jgi:hypothetical protein
MLSTTLTAIARLTLLSLRRLPPVDLDNSLSWKPTAFADESGALHRWVTVDKWDEDALAREAHGWRVFGDICVVDAPLTLHVVEIGQARKGRQQSPWARAYKHPVIAGLVRFQRPDGKGSHRPLAGAQWKPLWYADQPQPEPGAWVDRMDADAVTPGLLHHITIRQPEPTTRQETLRQIGILGQRMRELELEIPPRIELETAMEVPMSRPACDGWVPCAWQAACYRDNPAEGIGSVGLYQIRRREDAPYGRSRIQTSERSHTQAVASD